MEKAPEEKRRAGLVVSWALVAMAVSFIVPIAFPQWFPRKQVPDGLLAALVVGNLIAAYWFHPGMRHQ